MTVIGLFSWFDVLLPGYNEFSFFEEPLKSGKNLYFFVLKLFGFFAAICILYIKGSVAFDDAGHWLFNLHGLLFIITDQYRFFLFLFHVLYYWYLESIYNVKTEIFYIDVHFGKSFFKSHSLQASCIFQGPPTDHQARRKWLNFGKQTAYAEHHLYLVWILSCLWRLRELSPTKPVDVGGNHNCRSDWI